jgi:hypothetical protein
LFQIKLLLHLECETHLKKINHVTHFDHLFILYTGLVVGILCFVFPLIISVFNFFEKKRCELDQKDLETSDETLNLATLKINAPGSKTEERIKEFKKTNRALTKEERKRLIHKFLYNPKFRLWVIFIPLLLVLLMCVIDIYTDHSLNLTYYSFVPFIIAMIFLIDTFIKTVELIKE